MLYAAIRSMGRKKEKTINLTELGPEEKLKYEIAEELGLLDRVEVIDIKRDRADWRNGHRKKTRDKKTDRDHG